MKRKWLAAVALAVSASCVAAPTEVRLWHALDADMAAHVAQLADEYNGAQAEFLVRLSGLPEEGPQGLVRLPLPINTARPVLYYSRDAFRRARLGAPPKTWYDMLGTLTALWEAGERCAYTTAWPAWVMLENSGGVFSRQLMVRWTSMLATWERAGYFSYSGRGNEAEARFASGECAMVTASSASQVELARQARFEVGVAPLPHYEDGAPARGVPASAPAVWVDKQSVGVTSFLAFLARRSDAARRGREAMEGELEAVWRGNKTALDALEAYAAAMRPPPMPPAVRNPPPVDGTTVPIEKKISAPAKPVSEKKKERQKTKRGRPALSKPAGSS